MQVQFSIPAPIFTPYTKDDIHDKLKDNKRLACEVVLNVWKVGQTADEKADQKTKHLNGIGFNAYDAKFASDLAAQIEKKGWEKMSWKQTKFIFKFAHRYAGQAAQILNGGVVKAEPVKAPVKTRLRRKAK